MPSRAIPPEVRKIKIGGSGELRKSAKGNDWHLPEKWDHIGVTLPWKEDGVFVRDADVMTAIQDERGTDKPKAITVILPSDDYKEWYASFHAYYASRTLACYSEEDGKAMQFRKRMDADGNSVTVRVKDDGKWSTKPVRDWVETECDRSACEFAVSNQCKCHTKIAFLLPDNYARDLCGYAVLRTTSIKSKQNFEHFILHSFPKLTGGHIAHIPIDLCMYVTAFGKRTVRVLRLTWPGTRLELVEAVRERVALDSRLPHLGEIQDVPISLRPIDETPDEQADVQEEFHPGETLSDLEVHESHGYADEGVNLMEPEKQADILDDDEPCTEDK